MRKVQLKQATISTLSIIAVSVIVLAGLRSWVAAETPSDQGAKLFQSKGCVGCHFTDSQKTKFGPGLKGLFEREKLPESGRAVTVENVRKQFIDPYEKMPSFEDKLTEEQIDALIAYLKTL
jgi:cytochrome c2